MVLPKVSIIVPVYNGERLIGRCINSLSEQALPEIEIIIVNDGSSDQTEVVAGELARRDNRVKLVSIAKSGVSVARNVGLDIARGEFVAFADADDWVETNTYDTLYTVAVNYQADIVVCGFKCQAIRGEIIRRSTETLQVLRQDQIRQEFLPLLGRNTSIGNSTCNKLYRYEMLKRLNAKFITGVARGEDLEFNRLLFPQAQTVVLIPECLYNYYLLNSSVMRSVINNYELIYLSYYHRTLIYLRNNHLDSRERLLQLNSEMIKEILSNITYLYSKQIHKSLSESNKALLSLSDHEEIIKIVQAIETMRLSTGLKRWILRELVNKQLFYPALYGLTKARVIQPLREKLSNAFAKIRVSNEFY